METWLLFRFPIFLSCPGGLRHNLCISYRSTLHEVIVLNLQLRLKFTHWIFRMTPSNNMKIALLLALFALVSLGSGQNTNGYKKVCYFGNWMTYKPGINNFSLCNLKTILPIYILYKSAPLGLQHRSIRLYPSPVRVCGSWSSPLWNEGIRFLDGHR